MPIGAFFMNIQIVLALCLRFVSAIHLQLDREVGNNSKDVSDMKFKIASWIEKQNLAQPNFSDSDQSESSSFSNFDQLQQKGKEINRQEPRQERSRSGNFFGSIYFERNHSRRDKKNSFEAENDHEVGRRLSDVSDQYSYVCGSDASSDQHLYGRHKEKHQEHSQQTPTTPANQERVKVQYGDPVSRKKTQNNVDRIRSRPIEQPQNSVDRNRSRAIEQPQNRSRAIEQPQNRSRTIEQPQNRSRAIEHPQNSVDRNRSRAIEQPQNRSRAIEQPQNRSRAIEHPQNSVDRNRSRAIEQPQNRSRTIEQPQNRSRAIEQLQNSSRAIEQPQNRSRAIEQPQNNVNRIRSGAIEQPKNNVDHNRSRAAIEQPPRRKTQNSVDRIRSRDIEQLQNNVDRNRSRAVIEHPPTRRSSSSKGMNTRGKQPIIQKRNEKSVEDLNNLQQEMTTVSQHFLKSKATMRKEAGELLQKASTDFAQQANDVGAHGRSFTEPTIRGQQIISYSNMPYLSMAPSPYGQKQRPKLSGMFSRIVRRLTPNFGNWKKNLKNCCKSTDCHHPMGTRRFYSDNNDLNYNYDYYYNDYDNDNDETTLLPSRAVSVGNTFHSPGSSEDNAAIHPEENTNANQQIPQLTYHSNQELNYGTPPNTTYGINSAFNYDRSSGSNSSTPPERNYRRV
uniref:Uncharacterized protein n=1 Tax=Globodera rostochiensis TaxID=31243 RepID=A0A914H389_GLORO